MTNEHTPGPWHVTTFPTMATPIVCAGTLTIAGLVAMPIPGGHAINGEVWANARLIASAPETAAERDRLKEINAELLAALIEMEKEKSEYMLINHLGDPAEEHTNQMARAAIAKATGQALQDLADIGQELNI